MKKYRIIFLTIIMLTGDQLVFAWGFFAHKRINRMAVFTLPPGMFGFYKNHIEFLTEHAIDPDKRRNVTEGEEARHYIDIDHYPGENPFDSVPEKWKDAVEKFSEDTLKAYGIVPWHIQWMLHRLTDAFKENNLDKILRLSADIGHYVGDAHVPLHTTENYNGQLTNQKGIHGFWESRLPELFSSEYDFFTGQSRYIENPLDLTWDIIAHSYHAKDSVLLFEAELNERFPADRKYSYENRGQAMIKVYSEEYSNEYQNMLNGMVERRMRAAVITVGSFWLTAWINAGKPDLEKLETGDISDELKKEIEEEKMKWKDPKIKGREDNE